MPKHALLQQQLHNHLHDLSTLLKVVERTYKNYDKKITQIEKRSSEYTYKLIVRNHDLLLDKLKSEQKVISTNECMENIANESCLALSSIVQYSKLLLDVKIYDQQIDYIHNIHICAHKIMCIFKDMHILRQHRQATPLSKQAICLPKFLNDIIKIMQPRAAISNTVIELNNHHNVMEIYSNPILLQNILINLLHNACIYSLSRPVMLKVITMDNSIELQVHDHGLGMSKHKISKLFNVQAPPKGIKNKKLHLQGLGIGLFIVKKFCTIIDAEIRVESIKDKGSTFTITIKNAPKG